jgi:hypothetical protein
VCAGSCQYFYCGQSAGFKRQRDRAPPVRLLDHKSSIISRFHWRHFDSRLRQVRDWLRCQPSDMHHVRRFRGDRDHNAPAGLCSRPHRWCWSARPDLGERWPSRLVATAEEDRLSIQLIRCDDVCRLVKGPALAVFTMLRLTEFWVQQQICCGADNDESDDKHQHPIGHFPLPSGNPGA